MPYDAPSASPAPPAPSGAPVTSPNIPGIGALTSLGYRPRIVAAPGSVRHTCSSSGPTGARDTPTADATPPEG